MAVLVLTAAAVIMCPHGGTVAATAVASRVLIAGAPVLTVDAATVRNCGLPPSQACNTVIWQAGASRAFAGGQPVLTQSGTGMCLSAGQPTGSPLVVAVQSRVTAR